MDYFTRRSAAMFAAAQAVTSSASHECRSYTRDQLLQAGGVSGVPFRLLQPITSLRMAYDATEVLALAVISRCLFMLLIHVIASQ